MNSCCTDQQCDWTEPVWPGRMSPVSSSFLSFSGTTTNYQSSEMRDVEEWYFNEYEDLLLIKSLISFRRNYKFIKNIKVILFTTAILLGYNCLCINKFHFGSSLWQHKISSSQEPVHLLLRSPGDSPISFKIFFELLKKRVSSWLSLWGFQCIGISAVCLLYRNLAYTHTPVMPVMVSSQYAYKSQQLDILLTAFIIYIVSRDQPSCQVVQVREWRAVIPLCASAHPVSALIVISPLLR